MIDVRLPGETISGIFETIRHDGALELLCTDGQRRAIAAGEVFFPDALR
jgi:biotin-(acetyl-CoA carboxylase) ligase